jgi:hypothetical protein
LEKITLNQALRQDLETDLSRVLNTLDSLDTAFKKHYEDTPAEDLTPTVEFMSAWNKIKTVKQTLHTINLGNDV